MGRGGFGGGDRGGFGGRGGGRGRGGDRVRARIHHRSQNMRLFSLLSVACRDAVDAAAVHRAAVRAQAASRRSRARRRSSERSAVSLRRFAHGLMSYGKSVPSHARVALLLSWYRSRICALFRVL